MRRPPRDDGSAPWASPGQGAGGGRRASAHQWVRSTGTTVVPVPYRTGTVVTGSSHDSFRHLPDGAIGRPSAAACVAAGTGASSCRGTTAATTEEDAFKSTRSQPARLTRAAHGVPRGASPRIGKGMATAGARGSRVQHCRCRARRWSVHDLDGNTRRSRLRSSALLIAILSSLFVASICMY